MFGHLKNRNYVDGPIAAYLKLFYDTEEKNSKEKPGSQKILKAFHWKLRTMQSIRTVSPRKTYSNSNS